MRDRTHLMLLIVLALVCVMALAGLVTAFAAYPQRHQPIPQRSRLDDRMTKIRNRIEP